MQLHLPLSGEHVFFYDAGTAGDRRFAAGLCRGKADTCGSVEVLPQGGGALRIGTAAV